MTQKKAVLEYLQTGKTLTQQEAYELIGTQRLGAIIFNLRKDGLRIESIPVKSKNRFGNHVNLCKYYLIDNDYVNATSMQSKLKQSANDMLRALQNL